MSESQRAKEREAGGREPDRPGRRELLVGGAHLGGLWAIAMVQPLLDLLGSTPEFFVARGNSAGDILILTIGFAVVPPLALLGVESLVALAGRRAYRALHLGLVGLIAAALFAQIEKRIFAEPAALIILLALALGAAVAYGLARTSFTRNLMDVLAFAPPVVLAIFIFFSGASKLILPQAEADALGGSVREDTPVVMVIFDELPAATLMNERGQVRANRFPGFAKIAREATWYPNTTTVADFSGRAVPAIMTGKHSDGTKLPIAADQPESIFTLLGGEFELNVQETVTEVCPADLCPEDDADAGPRQRKRLVDLFNDLKYVQGRLVLPPSLAEDLPEVSTTFGDFGIGEEIPENKRAGEFVRGQFEPPSPKELRAFVDEIPESGRTLNLVHMEVPHEPFKFLPDGRRYNYTELSNLATSGAARWAVGPAGLTSIEQRHQLQTGYADTLIEAMVERLQATGVWDEALVIVTADHGISFQDDVLRRIAEEENLGTTANVPLLIKYPGQSRPRTSEQHVQTIDIVPTIAEVLGVEQMYETDGQPISEDRPDYPMEINNGLGETITAPIETVIEQRREAIERTTERLRDGGIYELGPAPELVGRAAPPAPDGDAVSFYKPSLFDNVKTGGDTLPAFVAGELHGEDAGEALAIAVNGEVAATTLSFLHEERTRFAVVLPPASLRQGDNSIEVHVVEDGELRPVGGN